MSLIVGQGVCKSWSDKDVLRNVAFNLAPHERVGLVGPNGQGKTTLLRIIAGIEDATSGDIQKKVGLRIGYLPQDPPAFEGTSLRQAMLEVFADLRRIEQEMHDLTAEMGGDCHDEKVLARFGQLQHEFETRGGYDYTRKIDRVLEGLGFTQEMLDRPLSTLSGGQRTRAFLARLLLEDPEVLLLDEPTNHLDLEAVEWLESFLESFEGSLIVVSHDRYFLDRTTRATWEVAFATVECYKGAYSHYLTQREERFKERMRRWQAQQEFIEETQEFIRRFLAGQRSKEAQGRRTRLERFMKTEAIEKPREHARIAVRFKTHERTGDFVLHLMDLKVGFKDPLVEVEKLDVMRGQRIAIVGPNGCGKTTMLRTVLGTHGALGGSARWGANVRVGYLSQTHNELSQDWTALEAVRQLDPAMTEERARGLLGALLLSGDDAFKRISELSGGQRSRVVLVRLMLQRANVLILDEPTNHLDILSQEVLQDVLSEFDGTILFVSHDRYLIQALATHIWAIHERDVTPLGGSWDKYLSWRQEQLELSGQAQAKPDAQQAAKAKAQRTEDYRERRRKTNEVTRLQRRLSEVETTIHKLETRMKTINLDLNKASEAGDIDKITNLGKEYTDTEASLQDLLAEWEQLGTELEAAGAE